MSIKLYSQSSKNILSMSARDQKNSYLPDVISASYADEYALAKGIFGDYKQLLDIIKATDPSVTNIFSGWIEFLYSRRQILVNELADLRVQIAEYYLCIEYIDYHMRNINLPAMGRSDLKDIINNVPVWAKNPDNWDYAPNGKVIRNPETGEEKLYPYVLLENGDVKPSKRWGVAGALRFPQGTSYKVRDRQNALVEILRKTAPVPTAIENITTLTEDQQKYITQIRKLGDLSLQDATTLVYARLRRHAKLGIDENHELAMNAFKDTLANRYDAARKVVDKACREQIGSSNSIYQKLAVDDLDALKDILFNDFRNAMLKLRKAQIKSVAELTRTLERQSSSKWEKAYNKIRDEHDLQLTELVNSQVTYANSEFENCPRNTFWGFADLIKASREDKLASSLFADLAEPHLIVMLKKCIALADPHVTGQYRPWLEYHYTIGDFTLQDVAAIREMLTDVIRLEDNLRTRQINLTLRDVSVNYMREVLNEEYNLDYDFGGGSKRFGYDFTSGEIRRGSCYTNPLTKEDNEAMRMLRTGRAPFWETDMLHDQAKALRLQHEATDALAREKFAAEKRKRDAETSVRIAEAAKRAKPTADALLDAATQDEFAVSFLQSDNVPVMAKDITSLIKAADPSTSGMYAPWLMRAYKDGDFSIRDIPAVREKLHYHAHIVKGLQEEYSVDISIDNNTFSQAMTKIATYFSFLQQNGYPNDPIYEATRAGGGLPRREFPDSIVPSTLVLLEQIKAHVKDFDQMRDLHMAA